VILDRLRQKDVTGYSSTTSPGRTSLPRSIGADPKFRHALREKPIDAQIHSTLADRVRLRTDSPFLTPTRRAESSEVPLLLIVRHHRG
jgi:hypothetical protein